MKILRASHLGMCFGVRDAIALAVQHAGTAPLTVLGDLVHNEAVLADLRARGIAVAADPADVETPTVMVTAHGASERKLAGARARGLHVVQATCPLVHVAHRAIKALLRDGYHPVIIGQRTHVEVRGLTGDLDEFDVVLDQADVEALAYHPRIGVAAQTTQPIRAGAPARGADPPAVPPVRRPSHRYGLSADQTAPAGRRRPGRPV